MWEKFMRAMFRNDRRHVVLTCAVLVISGWLAVDVSAQPMTGPIDLGTVQLNRNQPAPAPTPARKPKRAAAPSAAPAPQRGLDIKAFFGSFGGSGVSDGDDATYLGVTQRDLDVRIAAAADGFSVAWTTVVRDGPASQNPAPRRRATTMNFTPGPRAGLYRATDNGDPLTGGTVSWARIRGNTLNIYVFSVHDDGRHDIQTYARTLSGTGMDLVYTRVVDGERQRRVRGKLVKNAN
jgi:hypothetical protein